MKSIAARYATVLALTLAGGAQAQPAAEAQLQAREILMRMAGYLAGAPAYSVSVRSGYDALVAAHSRALAAVSRDIAAAISAMRSP